MKKIPDILVLLLSAIICIGIQSCADHDDPQLAPIDTTQVRVSANVKVSPDSRWSAATEEMTINLSDIRMESPAGVVLKSISLIANNGSARYTIDDKPFSGEPLEFKIPLSTMRGRVNLSLRGNLIKKDCRDAEVIIADNIQKIVFSESPEFECEGWLHVSVKSQSTTGEEYSNSFEVRSTDHFSISVPQNKLYWTPSSGTASTIEVALGGGATSWSPNTTFDCKITNTAIGNSSAGSPSMFLTLPNTPGSLNSKKLLLFVTTSYFGTWENVTIDPYNLNTIFNIIESEK